MRNPREFSRAGLFRFLVLTFALLAASLPLGTTAYAADAGTDTGVDAGPLAITPPSATVSPLGKQKFTASGGTGMGYVFSLTAAPSGGTITAAGAYKAGATAGVTDMVQLVDSAMNTATAAVMVTAGVTVAPSTATVAKGGMQTFVASGGTGPYTWAVTTSGSGAPTITPMGIYTAGAMAGTDVVTATDSLGATGTATVTVTAPVMVGIGAPCTNADGGIEPGVCPAGATCVDGVCCSTACTGQCQACNTSSMLGTCVTITGTPAGTRPGCAQSDPSNPCTSLTCDGTSATACTSFVGNETTCGIASCVDGLGTPGAVCEGDGGCVKVSPASCGVYACVADMCATKCNDTSQCSPGNFCDVKSGKCVKPPPVPDAGADAQSPTGPTTTSSGCSMGRTTRDVTSLAVLTALLGTWGFRRRRRP